ncbi:MULTISPECIES: energy transducer TonB [unclassified Flavobacterium]|uniref:energy transducer TonB n=1 Tax=unclassified Flavobacterium TaxID=196869 RepID=UPI00361A5562
MSKLNINKAEWLELVFEGKNKEYGAYQLRKEQGATTTKAFFSALVFLAGLAMLPILFSSFTDDVIPEKPIDVIDDEIRVTKWEEPKEDILPFIKQPKESSSQAPITTETLTNPVVVNAEVAPDTEYTKPEDVGKETTNDPNAVAGSGTSNTTGQGNALVETPVDNGTLIATPSMVEKNPLFPGGIDEFLRIVGNRFRTPELDEERTVRVVVFFVVEKDGSLTNITVPKNPGHGLDAEAIRVLKSIKTKWEPGVYRGQPVRTQYSLPIVVKLQ